MRIIQHPDGAALLRHAGGWLERAEAENNFLLGICGTPELAESSPASLFLTLEDRGELLGACVWAPPLPLTFTRLPESGVPGLVELLRERGVRPGELAGPAATAERFAGQWEAATGTRAAVTMRQGVYQLTRVRKPEGIPGRPREAREEDAKLLGDWAYAFGVDCRLPPREHESLRASMWGRIHLRSVLVWETDRPVSMAAFSGPTPHGMRVVLVYTPPELRGHGYASAAVAELSQRLLDSGRRFCFLFTDLDNATANKIYQAIGYEFVGEARLILFESRV